MRARRIKRHVNAGPDDVIVTAGSGMHRGGEQAAASCSGCACPSQLHRARRTVSERRRPLVLITHMEHHSNHTSWLETVVDLEVVPPDARGLVDLAAIPSAILARYRDRPLKIGAFTACSNVTGVRDAGARLARADARARRRSASSTTPPRLPTSTIDMHPATRRARLDAIYFSPHKFLGGPGSLRAC